MKLFLKYLQSKIRTILVFVCFAVLFLISIALFRLPLPSVLYPTVICAVIGILYLTVDYLRIKRKHEALGRLADLSADMLTVSVSPSTVTERDLENIIESLKREVSLIRTEDTQKFNDMLDYYTVWAHQIKTPISSMKLLLEQEDSESSRQLSADLFRIQSYVDMVLAFLRLDSETTDYLLREQDPDPLIRACVRKFSFEFIARKLSFSYQPESIRFVTDEKWFSFLLEQLLSNALKYTKEGGITITLKDHVLCLADTGIGIAPEDLPRLGQKGYTGQNGRYDHSATGLGLYLCFRIAANLGITMWLESEVGQGTKVFLRLPENGMQFE